MNHRYNTDDEFLFDFKEILNKNRLTLVLIDSRLSETLLVLFSDMNNTNQYRQIKLILEELVPFRENLFDTDIIYQLETRAEAFLYENCLEEFKNDLIEKVNQSSLFFWNKFKLKRMLKKMEPKEASVYNKIKTVNKIYAYFYAYLRNTLHSKYAINTISEIKDSLECYRDLMHKGVVR